MTALAILAAFLLQPAPPSLQIVVLSGEGAINNVRQRTARDLIVQVQDENHRPVAGAEVVFTLPDSGPSRSFATGGRQFRASTDPAGQAVARGFTPNRLSGNFQIRVQATFQAQTAATTISQANASAAAAAGAGSPNILATVRDFLGGHGPKNHAVPPGSLWFNPSEAKGYGLYSYILLANRPTRATAPRYRALIAAFLEMFTEAKPGEGPIPKKRLNITYLPVTPDRPRREAEPLADWALANYDHERAAALLARVGLAGGGPYIVSSLVPLGRPGAHPQTSFLQDLSWVPATLMPLYLRQFEREVSSRSSWVQRTLDSMALSLRTGIEILAAEEKVAVPALGALIRTISPPPPNPRAKSR